MRLVKLVSLGWICFVSCLLNSQMMQPAIPLPLDGEPRLTQVPPSAVLGSPQCDSLGAIYVRYAAPANGSSGSSIARIEADGSTQMVSLDPLPGSSGDGHPFIFSTDSDGSFHEILRAPAPDHRDSAAGDIEYVRFDSDGAVRSEAAFAEEFIPFALLPLPSGSFFAAGVTLQPANGEVAESPLVGIFGPDAVLQRRLRSDSSTATRANGNADGEDISDAVLHAQTVRLGDDGNLYLLLAGEHAEVAVATQAGQITRKLALQEPFGIDVASDMWVSGNRLLVVYEGEANDPKDAFVYMLYDAQSGELIRAYKPEFSGTVACFQDGQTLSVLVRQQASGTVGLSTAELR